MSEAVREMTYEEQIANAIINILAIETPFGVKRDLISTILSLSYMYERDVKNALYTPLPEPPQKTKSTRRSTNLEWLYWHPEELAALIYCPMPSPTCPHEEEVANTDDDDVCHRCLLDWLKEEHKDDDT